ncbi:VanW family protein [Clostridium sp. DJ247]|uniref:VanW family protein n=1 Tax=Clostridium sp. DJ247 TaxID=2726188 RepID=UPI001627A287|nr:VanW family protein [Clostridium sp. DJ247]MBC2581508.1 hypothetical protein [Clostridium sp. DJ247]
MARRKRSTKKKLPLGIIIVAAALTAGAVGFISYQYIAIKPWSNLIYPGVKVQGEDLSGKTKSEAKKILEQNQVSAVMKKKIHISTPGKAYTLDYSQINPKYNIDETIDEVFNYGKNLSLFKRYKLIKGSGEKQYELKFSYNPEPINNLISGIEKDVNKDPVDAKIRRTKGSFAITPEQNGKKLQKDALHKEILSNVNGSIGQDITIKAPIETVGAKITQDKLSSVNSRIGTFSTDYASISSPERANNIVLSTRSINGKVLMPGDTFSFNDVVGERTADRGYQSAPVIIGNQIDSGLGGGICQVSTTLYNAVLKSNIKATVRAHHTLPSHYVPLGMDATVDWGNLDYKFKNTLDYPLYIEGSTAGGSVVFNIYSNDSLADTVTDLRSQVYQTIQPGVKYIDDPTLPVGQTEQVQPPYTGYKVKVIKTTTRNGQVISQDVIADDFYYPVDAEIKRGTKK